MTKISAITELGQAIKGADELSKLFYSRNI